MGNDLAAVAQQVCDSMIGLDAVDGAVEARHLALGREYIGKQKIAHAACQDDAQHDHAQIKSLLRCSRSLLACRELGPGDNAVVVKRRDRMTAGAGG